MARPKGVKEKKKRNRKIPPSTKAGPKEMKVVFQNLFNANEQLVWGTYTRKTGKEGGTALFNHPDQMLMVALKYFEWSDTHPIPSSDIRLHRGKAVDVGPGLRRPYSLINFCHFCGVTFSWMKKWRSRINNHPEFDSVIQFLEEACRNQQIDGAMVGQFNSLITARMNGLTDNVNITNSEPKAIPSIQVYNTAPPLGESEDQVIKRIDNGKEENSKGNGKEEKRK